MEIKKKNKILLIDNDEMTRIYFRDIFWIHGRTDTYEVILSSNLNEALLFIENKETRPNIIFIDILMEEKDGKNDTSSQIKRSYDFVTKIKGDNNYSDIKIVIYSSHKDKKVEKEFIKLGVDGFLIKGDLMPKELIAFADKVYGSNN
ncbi:MAG: response regulator [Candidatus Moranbacteria bacterium]|nr:response regulator [Candidatus Moranbacteria bacterium]